MRHWLAALAALTLASCAVSDGPPSIPPATDIATPPEVRPPVAERLTWTRIEHMSWPAPQRAFRQYSAAVRRALWEGVYGEGGTELYCRAHFTGADAADQVHADIELQLEHVYPADSIADHFGYTNRSCNTRNPGVAAADADQQTCKAAAGDLYNLFPAYAPMNQSRGSLAYAALPGEGTTNVRYRDICRDFERARIGEEAYVEPDDEARGDIARSILYMHFVYGLPFESVIADRELLIVWANDDPVDDEERQREERIRQAQPGSWNSPGDGTGYIITNAERLAPTHFKELDVL